LAENAVVPIKPSRGQRVPVRSCPSKHPRAPAPEAEHLSREGPSHMLGLRHMRPRSSRKCDGMYSILPLCERQQGAPSNLHFSIVTAVHLIPDWPPNQTTLSRSAQRAWMAACRSGIPQLSIRPPGDVDLHFIPGEIGSLLGLADHQLAQAAFGLVAVPQAMMGHRQESEPQSNTFTATGFDALNQEADGLVQPAGAIQRRPDQTANGNAASTAAQRARARFQG
jgi:hypothetical protein